MTVNMTRRKLTHQDIIDALDDMIGKNSSGDELMCRLATETYGRRLVDEANNESEYDFTTEIASIRDQMRGFHDAMMIRYGLN